MADPDDFRSWLDGWDPAPVTMSDAMDPGPSEALAAALDRPPPPAPWLPPLWHWLHFLRWPPTDTLGPDGHPTGGEFLPPIPGRTRMFGGGRIEVVAGLRTGVEATRHSAVTSQSVKAGRAGTMLFVTVRHQIEQGGTVALVDEQDTMYRSGAAAPGPAPGAASGGQPDSDAAWQEPFCAGPALLFRFSALTANSHRIHYDQPYATGVEGYPGLVVHGPLLAVALAGLVARHAPDRAVASMRYRFVRPTFAGDRALLTGRPHDGGADLEVLGPGGAPRAVAAVTWR